MQENCNEMHKKYIAMTEDRRAVQLNHQEGSYMFGTCFASEWIKEICTFDFASGWVNYQTQSRLVE